MANTNRSQKLQLKHASEHLSVFNNQLDSQVRRLLHNLSSRRDIQVKANPTSMSDSIFTLKLSAYDTQTQEKRKFQLRNQSSPQKWSVSTNQNNQFSHIQRVKGHILTGWDMSKTHLSKRSYENPKDYHGIKADMYSRQFPKDLSKTYSKGFNRKLKQIQQQFDRRVFEGKIKTIEQKKQRSIQGIRSRGSRFQLSKDKLFGFVGVDGKKQQRVNKMGWTMSSIYKNRRSQGNG